MKNNEATPLAASAPDLGSGKPLDIPHVTIDVDHLSWAESGRYQLATTHDVSLVLGTDQGNTPLPLGLVEQLRSLNAAQYNSPAVWETLNSVAKDILGDSYVEFHRPE
jgi:hypothetical protein